MSSSTAGLDEQWELVAAGNGTDETYNVVNASSCHVLDDPNSSTSNGTKIIQYQLNGGANQKWTFVPLADGNDLIVNASSGMVLGDPGFSTSNGTGSSSGSSTSGSMSNGRSTRWRTATI